MLLPNSKTAAHYFTFLGQERHKSDPAGLSEGHDNFKLVTYSFNLYRSWEHSPLFCMRLVKNVMVFPCTLFLMTSDICLYLDILCTQQPLCQQSVDQSHSAVEMSLQSVWESHDCRRSPNHCMQVKQSLRTGVGFLQLKASLLWLLLQPLQWKEACKPKLHIHLPCHIIIFNSFLNTAAFFLTYSLPSSASSSLPAGDSVPSSTLCSHCRTEGAVMGVLGEYW